MRQAEIYRNGTLAGILREENRRHFVFRYDEKYFADNEKPAVSLTLPKTQQEYHSEFLFPFFSNMLSEGANREIQSQMLRIDENDDFGILLATGQYDTIGAITVKPLKAK
jgi:serine/threonine-protein kinase HipA